MADIRSKGIEGTELLEKEKKSLGIIFQTTPVTGAGTKMEKTLLVFSLIYLTVAIVTLPLKISNSMKLLWILASAAFILPSCKTITVVKKMQSKKAAVSVWSNNDKIVLFVPMAHVGQVSFYEDVKEIIADGKQNNFRVYYEGVPAGSCTDSVIRVLKEKSYVKQFYKGPDNNDSVCADTYNRKLKRMIGVNVDTTGYAKILHQKGIFKKLVDQPGAEELGITDADIRVDLAQNQLVDLYEEKYGEIELEQIDYAIEVGSSYPGSLKLPRKNVTSIIIDSRDIHLANYLASSPDKKIIVIYGAAHEGGVFRELQRIDGSWKVTKVK